MDEKTPKVYFCDPKKNTMCNQSNCFLNGGPCSHTTNIAFVDLDKESKAFEKWVVNNLTEKEKWLSDFIEDDLKVVHIHG